MSHPWMPASPCDTGCLPPPETVTKASPYRMLRRLALCIVLLVVVIGLAAVFPVLPESQRRLVIKAWFRALLKAIGVTFVVNGEDRLVSGGALVVTNHVSWLDVVALQATRPMRLLAKTEVRSWPLLGTLASRAGTVYIDRDRLRALPEAVTTIADTLREGAVVGAFPEGTTWCGRRSGRYRPAVFQSAIDSGAPVQPMAMRFRTDDGPTTLAAFVGDATLVESVLTVARADGLMVELCVLPAVDSRRIRDRRRLARIVEAAVADATCATPVSQAPYRHALAG